MEEEEERHVLMQDLRERKGGEADVRVSDLIEN